jgi:hypothetical protein
MSAGVVRREAPVARSRCAKVLPVLDLEWKERE